MGGIEHQRAEKRLIGLFVRGGDEIHCGIGEQFGYITPRLHRVAVVDELIGEFVAFDVPVVMSEKFIEPALLRLVSVILSQMPFAEQARAIVGAFEKLGDSDLVFAQCVAPEAGVVQTSAKIIAAGHDAGPCGGAYRCGIKTCELHTLARNTIHVRCGDVGIARDAGVPVTLIISHY